MSSRGVLVLLLVAAAAAPIVRTSAETSRRNSPAAATGASNRERVDLSAEATGSDYPKQFGTPRHGPVYAQNHGHLTHNWSPYHPHRPIHHEDHHYYDQSRIDPYVVYLFTRYARFLPQGLGLYGIYGSTGLPHTKPPGVFSFPHRDK